MLFPEYKNYIMLDIYQLLIRAREYGLDPIDGTVQLINTVWRNLRLTPDDVVCCCFDSTVYYRRNLCTHYKANRNCGFTSDETSKLKDILSENYFIMEQEGLEADDIIAILCEQFPTYNKIIVSNDEDLYQLLKQNTSLYRYVKNSYHMYGVDDFIRDYKIKPHQWAMVKAIAGCSSDNVKGIKGMGTKKALEFILEDKHKDLIAQHQNTINLNLKLVSIPFSTDV